MRKLYYFFVTGGKVICIWALIFIISITCQSVVIKGKVDYGNRCIQSFDDNFVLEYKYKGTELRSQKLECNTYYLEYQTELDEKQNILFLSTLSKLFYDHGIDCDIHLILIHKNYQMIATIVDYKVSYIVSETQINISK